MMMAWVSVMARTYPDRRGRDHLRCDTRAPLDAEAQVDVRRQNGERLALDSQKAIFQMSCSQRHFSLPIRLVA
jgi:hypothetical protein